LRFNHAGNMPFSVRGTGITFRPATAFAHSSNEPVQPLGTGIQLDKPLAKNHEINAVVRDAVVKTAGYQGTPEPNQWFGGPALSASAGNMVLRDAAGLVVDSLNYGLLVDPWASEGYHGISGAGQSGCLAPAPGFTRGFGPPTASTGATNRSAGRFPDGADTDSNCGDFLLQPGTTLSSAVASGANNIKVAGVANFKAGQTVLIDTGTEIETVVIESVGTAGATTANAAVSAGASVIPVGSVMGFAAGQTILVGSGAEQETAVVASVTFGFRNSSITIAAPLKSAHTAGTAVSGTGITLKSALTKAHGSGTQVALTLPTPGAPNQYVRLK
jgi:hypothetical protein